MEQWDLHDSRVLIVDDQQASIDVLLSILRPAGYRNILTTTDPRKVLELCRADPPDIVLLDVLMPDVDGFAVIELLKENLPDFALRPILMLTSDDSREAKQRALSSGASDFLTKPLSPREVRLRVANLLRTRYLQAALHEHNLHLEDSVRRRTVELVTAQHETLEKLALAAEWRDDETGEHTRRVGEGSAALARDLGLGELEVEVILRSAPLHDIGKIGIPDAVLLKPGKLTDDERSLMRTHTTIGAAILRGSSFPTLQRAEDIAHCHHECWDGSGYPRGLAGEAIPETARIVAVVDNFDSLTHKRPYKRAWSAAEALKEIRAQAGRMFDPDIVQVFLASHRVKTPGRRSVSRKRAAVT